MNLNLKLAAAALVAGMAVSANAVTIDFTGLTPGTVVTTQYPGVTFSLVGGFTGAPPAVGNVFGGIVALGNSGNNQYPTAFTLNVAFSQAVSNVSFTFNNFGSSNGSNYVANNGSSALIDQLGGYNLYSVAGGGITNLAINNNNNESWLFGVSTISFESAVPEPATWGLMIAGFGLIGTAMRRRVTTAAA